MVISPNKWELDVQGYLNLCNITATTPRQQIRDFAAGVNDLGLWNNMVCWPLRSSQNAGTGTTAFSLGGLGTFNGTLVNGPTWGADGVVFDGTNDIITTNVVPISGAAQRTLFVVARSSSGSLNAIAVLVREIGNFNGDAWGILQFPNTTTRYGWVDLNDNTIGTVASGSFASTAFGYSTARFGFVNGVQQTITGSTAVPNTSPSAQVVIGGRDSSAAWPFNDAISFVALFNTGSSSTNIHSLYRDTIGTGLGLP